MHTNVEYLSCGEVEAFNIRYGKWRIMHINVEYLSGGEVEASILDMGNDA